MKYVDFFLPPDTLRGSVFERLWPY